ncbi:MAG: hypothetical protein ACE5D4_05100 [Thermodesulfobacteriota bacterium]
MALKRADCWLLGVLFLNDPYLLFRQAVEFIDKPVDLVVGDFYLLFEEFSFRG